MVRCIVLVVLFMCSSILSAQDSLKFVMRISADTILMGNDLAVEFEINNAQGLFEPPSFQEMILVSGPNYNSSMQITNGQVRSQSSYSFILKPDVEGGFYIDPAYLITGQDTLETPPIKIHVLANPSEIFEKIPPRDQWKTFDLEGAVFEEKIAPLRKRKKLYRI